MKDVLNADQMKEFKKIYIDQDYEVLEETPLDKANREQDFKARFNTLINPNTRNEDFMRFASNNPKTQEYLKKQTDTGIPFDKLVFPSLARLGKTRKANIMKEWLETGIEKEKYVQELFAERERV